MKTDGKMIEVVRMRAIERCQSVPTQNKRMRSRALSARRSAPSRLISLATAPAAWLRRQKTKGDPDAAPDRRE